MPDIQNSEPFFDPFNNGWMYLCPDTNGTDFWICDVAGNWSKPTPPLGFANLHQAFQTFIQKTPGGDPAQQLITDDEGQQVIPPPV